jgi:hypothetical protein
VLELAAFLANFCVFQKLFSIDRVDQAFLQQRISIKEARRHSGLHPTDVLINRGQFPLEASVQLELCFDLSIFSKEPLDVALAGKSKFASLSV